MQIDDDQTLCLLEYIVIRIGASTLHWLQFDFGKRAF